MFPMVYAGSTLNEASLSVKTDLGSPPSSPRYLVTGCPASGIKSTPMLDGT